MSEKNEKTPVETPGTTESKAPATLPLGLSTLMNASGRTSNLKSIEEDGSFPMYKLKCSDLVLRGKMSSSPNHPGAVEMIMTVTHINGQQLPQVKQFGVTDPSRHSTQVPQRLPKPVNGFYYLEASFGKLDITQQQNNGLRGSQFLPGDDGIRIINLSVPDGIPYEDMWSAEKRVLNNPALIEANRRKSGALAQRNEGYVQQAAPQAFQAFPTQTFATPQSTPVETPKIDFADFGG